MLGINAPLTFRVNFPQDILDQAETFRRQQSTSEKGGQVYLNTLAVYAVHFYCICLGVETNLTAGDSWSPAMQMLMDIADLSVPGGSLECRPITPGENACSIPPEATEERLGYVLVEIDLERNEAKLLGFKKTVNNGLLHRSQLQSLDDLVDGLVEPELIVSEISRKTTQLGEWFKDIFDELWQPPELILSGPHRGGRTAPKDAATSSTNRKRAKLLTVSKHELVLLVQIERIGQELSKISLEIRHRYNSVLSEELLIELLDDESNVVMSTSTDESDNFRGLDFQIERSELFKVRISADNESITESFLS